MQYKKRVHVKPARAKRKYAFVIVKNVGDLSIREILQLQEPPKEDSTFTEDEGVTYCVGPFKTNAAAQLFKDNPGVYQTVLQAEKAVKAAKLAQMPAPVEVK